MIYQTGSLGLQLQLTFIINSGNMHGLKETIEIIWDIVFTVTSILSAVFISLKLIYWSVDVLDDIRTEFRWYRRTKRK